MQTLTKTPLFPVGQTVATRECLAEILACGEFPTTYVYRHCHGDYGDLGAADKAENDLSIKEGYRILSAYVLPSGKRIYCITEHDRSLTTLLLCSEY
jgi:hypothetical protein